MDAMGEEVGGVGDENNKTAFDLGEPPDVSKLEKQRSSHAHDHSDEQTPEEDDQKDAHTLEETKQAVAAGFATLILLRRLKDNNGNGVVQDGLAEDDGVELGVDLVGIKDGEDGYGIGGRKCGTDGDGVNKGHVEGPWDERK